MTTRVDDNGEAWTLVPSSLGVYWLNLYTIRISSSSEGTPVLGHGCWAAPGFGSTAEAVEAFHIFPTRSWILDFFNELLVSGNHFLGVLSSVHSCVRKNFAHFLLHAVKSGHYFHESLVFGRWYFSHAMLGSTVALLGASERFSHLFSVKGNSDPEVAFVHRCCFSCFPGPVALGNWTLLPRALRFWQFLVRC